MSEGELEEISVDSLKPIESGKGLDLSEFEGRKAKIVTLKVVDATSSYDENGNFVQGLQRKVKKLRVSTDAVTKITSKEGKEFPVYGSEWFNLKRDTDGSWGISTHEKASIQRFMKRQKVSNVKDLVGTSVTLKVNGDFLGFITQ